MVKYFTLFLITVWFAVLSGNVIYFIFNLMAEQSSIWFSLGIFLLINVALVAVFKVGMMICGVNRIFPPPM